MKRNGPTILLPVACIGAFALLSAAGASNAWAVDTDRDGIQDGSDNCPTVPNADQANCGGAAAGNLCEAAWASRDDDGDGVCNGADGAAGLCAHEAGTA